MLSPLRYDIPRTKYMSLPEKSPLAAKFDKGDDSKNSVTGVFLHLL